MPEGARTGCGRGGSGRSGQRYRSATVDPAYHELGGLGLGAGPGQLRGGVGDGAGVAQKP